MAMLAEPRRKQRIGPNPRGKFFMEDDSNSGKQLLQKMGWKQGDGLGVQKQGMVEPVKPKIQMTNKGVGYTIRNDPWIDHSNDFADILKRLNEENGTNQNENESVDQVEPSKLENKSKSSRARIHYHKFVKGKDLSRASSKDLESIFGTNYKAHKVLPLSEENPICSENNDMEIEEKEVDEDSKTINRGSMHDYFAKKMEKMKLKQLNLTSVSVEVVEEQEDLDESKKKRKKKKKRELTEPESNLERAEDESNLPVEVDDSSSKGLDPESEVEVTETTKRKRKRRNKSPSPGSDSPIKECSTSVQDTIPEEEANPEIEIPEISVKKSKKSKRIIEDSSSVNTESTMTNTVSVPEAKSIPVPIQEGSKFVSKGSMVDYFAKKMDELRSKQLRKTDNGLSDEIVKNAENPVTNQSLSMNESEELEVEVEVTKKSKKKKNKSRDKDSDQESSIATPEIANTELCESEQPISNPDVIELEKTKKKKKKRKDKERDINTENPEVDLETDQALIVETATPEVDPNINGQTELTVESVNENHSLKSTKYKKRRRDVSPGAMKKLSKKFKGSNLNKINGYALY